MKSIFKVSILSQDRQVPYIPVPTHNGVINQVDGNDLSRKFQLNESDRPDPGLKIVYSEVQRFYFTFVFPRNHIFLALSTAAEFRDHLTTFRYRNSYLRYGYMVYFSVL